MLPIAIFLIPYGLFLLVFLFFSFVNLYHLIRFGTTGLVGFFVTFFYLAVAVLILYATYTYAAPINWSHEIDVIPSLGPPSFESG